MGCGAAAGYEVREDDAKAKRKKRKKLRQKPEDAESSDIGPGPRDYWELVRLLKSRPEEKTCKRLGMELEGMLMDLQEPSRGGPASSGCLFAAPCDWRRSSKGGGEPAEVTQPELLEWDALLCGPDGTPYEGGVYYLHLKFPTKYPQEAPMARFVTPVWHPNIDAESGKICLNVLQEEWSPTLNVSSLLLCISALLSQPDPEDPLNHAAAEMMHFKPSEFTSKARRWTDRYARDEGPLDFVLLLAEARALGAGNQGADDDPDDALK